MGIVENSIQKYKNNLPMPYISESGKYVDFYNFINQQFTVKVLHNITNNNEQFVNYWPVYALFNLEKKRDKDNKEEVRCTHGTGFLVLSDKSAYLYLYSNFSKKHLPFRGIGNTLVRYFFGETIYLTSPIRQDMEIKGSVENMVIQRIMSVYGVDMLPIELGPRSFHMMEVIVGHNEEVYEYMREVKHLGV